MLPGGEMLGKAAPKMAVRENRRLLVVEDEVLVRLIVAEAAREAGYLVAEAESADAALAYLASGRPVDLVFSDIGLPGSMSGSALARKLADERPEIKVVLTSGQAGAYAVEGIAPFIAKPYSIVEGLILIAVTLAQSPADG
jgi:CheY-like chemotaxis protein